ncbi:hypothetical protein B0H17DRAFT_1131381 [Mycena rosella]|uniref:Uncharacterized protein n=1 Tax=Mycena rosella TaxID=1033263 RepID=A0AAD7GHX5_MYCRO|nr:hypothetical protein B0H17DRAFT_1131381 [Mycena rosella]
MSTLRSFLVTGSNQGLRMHTVHKLASTPNVLVFMGARKLSAAEEARAKFTADINLSSAVVPVQLDITDTTSIKNAHIFIANHLKEKSLSGLDVLINNAARLGTFEERPRIPHQAHPVPAPGALPDVQLKQVHTQRAHAAVDDPGGGEVLDPLRFDLPCISQHILWGVIGTASRQLVITVNHTVK